jgi:predicted ATP-dependent endonuclease of OLD family
MKLAAVRIENYRSIQNVFVEFKENTVLVGPNDHGKTNILKAVRDVFNFSFDDDGKKITTSGFYYKNKRRNSNNAALRVSFYVEDLPTGLRYGKRKKKEAGISVQFYASGDVVITSRKKDLTNKDTLLAASKAKDLYFKIRKKMNVFYVPTFRNIEDHLYGSTENSVLFSLLSQYLSSSVETKKGGQTREYKTIRKIKNEINKLVSKSFLDIKGVVNKYVPSHLGTQFKFKFLDSDQVESEDKTLSQMIAKEIFIIDSLNKDVIKNLGSGIQQAITIGLLEKMIFSEELKTVVLFEEPETFLHPSAQKELYLKLLELTDGSLHQTIFSTHSPSIVDETELDQVVLIQKKKSNTVAMQYRQNGFFEEEKLIELKANNYFRNSDVFFSKLVLFVEGISDKYILENCLKEILGDEAFQISIVPCGGNTKFLYPIMYLSSFGDGDDYFKWILLSDKDTFKNKNTIKELKKIPKLAKLNWDEVKNISNKVISKRSGILIREEIKAAQENVNRIVNKQGLYCLQADIEYSLVTNSNMDSVRSLMLELFPDHDSFFSNYETSNRVAELIGSKGPNSDWTSLTKDQRAKFKDALVHNYLSAGLDKSELSLELRKLAKYISAELKK